jgi:hypothetical protein
MKTLSVISCLLYLSILSCEKTENGSELSDFCSVIPDNWQCQIITKDFDSTDIPKNTPAPSAIVKYVNFEKQILHYGDIMINPSLVLDLYPVSKKEELIQFLKSQQIYSWCIPEYFGETDEYFIITSPCFINSGTFTPAADSSIVDLYKALSEIIKVKKYTGLNDID